MMERWTSFFHLFGGSWCEFVIMCPAPHVISKRCSDTDECHDLSPSDVLELGQ